MACYDPLFDIKITLSDTVEKNVRPFERLMCFFSRENVIHLEKSDEAKAVYNALGWNEKNHDVINSFWMLFTRLIHIEYPYKYKLSSYGNIRGLYKDSFPEHYLEAYKTYRSQADALRKVYRLDELAELCHCAANFMPCPDNLFNTAKGTSKACDFLPLVIQLIESERGNGFRRVFIYQNTKMISGSTIRQWGDWFIKNRERYCLSMYYDIDGERLVPKMLFNGQTLDHAFPVNRAEGKECVDNIIRCIKERAEIMAERLNNH